MSPLALVFVILTVDAMGVRGVLMPFIMIVFEVSMPDTIIKA